MAGIPQNLGVPTGTIMWSASETVPVGWLLCDGRFVTPGDYPALYAYIGNIYGGNTITFALPDLVGRFALGAGDPGRQPFTQEDGVNKEHIHGMFKDQTHFHGVTDPQHEHPTSSGAHEHDTTSNHNHPNTTNHTHIVPGMKTHTYILANTCKREVYAPDNNGNCSRDAEDFFITDKNTDLSVPFSSGKTGITSVNTAQTGTSVQIAFTGVTLANQFTGITLQNATTGISVDDFGVIGGPRPFNIAFLPIIRS